MSCIDMFVFIDFDSLGSDPYYLHYAINASTSNQKAWKKVKREKGEECVRRSIFDKYPGRADSSVSF